MNGKKMGFQSPWKVALRERSPRIVLISKFKLGDGDNIRTCLVENCLHLNACSIRIIVGLSSKAFVSVPMQLLCYLLRIMHLCLLILLNELQIVM